MARIEKVDNALKKRLERKEKKRNVATKNQRVYFLIVCEGEKTEPNYFQGLKKDLPVNTLVISDLTVEGTGKNTESLVDFTIKFRNRSNRRFDRTWVVFDKDSFTDEQFNNAIVRAGASNIKCAWSNEAFELWFLLHFQYINNGMPRRDYQSFLEREIKRVSGQEYRYRKNDVNTYTLLKQYGDQSQAIAWAKSLHTQFTDARHANHNPCTLVYLLVEELFDPTEILQTI